MLQQNRLIALLAILLILSAATSAQTPDVKALMKETAGNLGSFDLSNYYFKMRYRLIAINKKGDEEFTATQLYEVFTPSKTPKTRFQLPMILLERDGAPLSEAELVKQREQAVLMIEKVEGGNSKGLSGRSVTIGENIASGRLFSLGVDNDKALRTFDGYDFSFLRQEVINGRDSFVVFFRPRDGADGTQSEQVWAGLAGAMWIDAADKQLVRVEGFLPKEAAQLVEKSVEERKSAAKVVCQQTRLTDGLWFPEYIRIENTLGVQSKVLARHGLEVVFSDYKRFNTEAKDAKIDAPKN